MKTETILAETNFRQLTSYEIDYPLYCIGHFWSVEAYIESFRIDIYNWIKTACSLSNDQFGDPDEFELLHQQCIKLIEIAHVLYTSDQNFSTEKDHLIYRPNNECFGYHLEDQQILTCPSLYFRTLNGAEINDVRVFFEEFFEFKNLNGWHGILDQVLISSREEISLVRNEEIGHTILEINEYLEKLVESIYVIYETRAVSYTSQCHTELPD